MKLTINFFKKIENYLVEFRKCTVQLQMVFTTHKDSVCVVAQSWLKKLFVLYAELRN